MQIQCEPAKHDQEMHSLFIFIIIVEWTISFLIYHYEISCFLPVVKWSHVHVELTKQFSRHEGNEIFVRWTLLPC